MVENNSSGAFTIGEVIQKAWDVFKKNPGLLIGVFVVNAALSIITGMLWGANIVITGPLAYGINLIAYKLIKDEKAEFNDLFAGFSNFGNTFMAGLLITIFTVIGGVFCIVPGLIVATLYMFTYLYIYVDKLDFWPAMEASRKKITQFFGQIFLLTLALVGINVIGALLLGIGLFVTLPVSLLATVIAFERIRNTEPAAQG